MQTLHMTSCPQSHDGDTEEYSEEPLFERLNQEALIIRHNNQLLREYYQQEELRPCSFAPQTLNNGDKRSLYQFLEDQQNHVIRVEQKREQIKLQEISRDEAHPYHPQTNEYVFQDRDESIPTYERLYKLNQKKPEAPLEELIENKPTIQSKSKNMVRTGKVEDILYNDALRRNQKQKENKEQKIVTVSFKFTSNNSERIVAQKFIREYETVIDWIFDQTGQDRPSNVSFSIDYLKLGEILQRLYFLSPLTLKDNERAVEYENLRLSEERALLCEIWSILRGDELGGVSKRNLCLFLLTLIGITDFKIKELPNGEQKQDYLKSIQPQQNKITTAHQPQDKKKLGKIDPDGNIIFSFEETKKLQKQFDILYRNRLTSEELKKTTWKDENPYKPTINQNKALVNQYRERVLEQTANLIDNQIIKVSIPENGQITHADLLVLQRKTQDYQLELKKKELHDKEMLKCPFRPQIKEERRSVNSKTKHEQLYQLAKPHTTKRDRTTEEIEFEKQQDDCTFQPQTRNSVKKNNQELVNRDVDKTVQRMRQAREKRDQVTRMLERGYNTNQPKDTTNQTEKSKTLSRSHSQSQVTQSSRQKSQESQHVHTYQSQNYHVEEQQQSSVKSTTQQDDRIPLLFVDVNLAPNKTERIIVYEGDLSSELAARFADEHNLDEFMQEKLKELLDYQISGLLTKIDEEDGPMSDNEN